MHSRTGRVSLKYKNHGTSSVSKLLYQHLYHPGEAEPDKLINLCKHQNLQRLSKSSFCVFWWSCSDAWSLQPQVLPQSNVLKAVSWLSTSWKHAHDTWSCWCLDFDAASLINSKVLQQYMNKEKEGQTATKHWCKQGINFFQKLTLQMWGKNLIQLNVFKSTHKMNFDEKHYHIFVCLPHQKNSISCL